MPAHSVTSQPDLLESGAFIDRLRAADDQAFTHLVTTLTPHLLAVARRITQSDSDAEDAVQGALLSAFRALGEFDGRSSLRTWIHRMVVNAALSLLRKRNTQRAVSIEQLQPEFADGFHKSHPKLWQTIPTDDDARTRQVEALWRALGELPQEFQDVILLRDVGGMDSKAVATALGVSDALVRQRLHRARQALVKLLEPVMTEVRS
jgi:RNA polymerase sigma-70 factor (ECF subfamily)